MGLILQDCQRQNLHSAESEMNDISGKDWQVPSKRNNDCILRVKI